MPPLGFEPRTHDLKGRESYSRMTPIFSECITFTAVNPLLVLFILTRVYAYAADYGAENTM